VLLALAVAISGDGGNGTNHRSPIVSLWVLLCGAAFVAAWMVAVKPAMAWVARRADAAGDGSSEAWVAVTLAGVLASGLATDVIGIHAIFGAFVFGLTVPKEGGFAARVTARVEDLVSELLLPLYFASSGLKTDVATIRGGEAWAMLALVIATACAGKIVGTFGVAMACGMRAKEALVLGVVMNTKGLVELIVLNIGRERKVHLLLRTSNIFNNYYVQTRFSFFPVRCNVLFSCIGVVIVAFSSSFCSFFEKACMKSKEELRSHVSEDKVKQRSPGSRW
jgi:Kef-type K+ transport system membrane component KefB